MLRRRLILLLLGAASVAVAQDSAKTYKPRWYTLHAQETNVGQYKPPLSRVPYTGRHSLIPDEEWVNTITSTLFAAIRPWRYAQFVFNPEVAGGSGLSGALGIANASNGESFRVGNPEPTIYVARAYFRQLFALGKARELQPDDENDVEQMIPVRYISVTLGKVSIADYFDDNTFSHNARTQFLAWGLMSNGAWDYPANTRGYTPSAVLELVTEKWEVRYGISMLPTTANGNIMDQNVSRANGQTFEVKYKYSLGGRAGKISALAFMNTARMGSYTATNIVFTDSIGDYNIAASEQYGRTKYGFGLNLEQYLSKDLGFFARASWNDGKTETWCFTEIDRAFSAGFSLKGTAWKRKTDVLGVAYSLSGLSDEHADYLGRGGLGFIIGDGQLNYAPEHLWEAYYSLSLLNDRIVPSLAYQFVLNPAYNKDRGPASIFSLRLHIRI